MGKKVSLQSLLLVILVLVPGASCAMAARGEAGLPRAVTGTIRSTFPGATVRGYEMERENGVVLYCVELVHGGRTVEVEVARDGDVCEVETVLLPDQVPEDIAKAARKATKGAEIVQVQKHEVRGSPRAGRVVKLDPHLLFYEVDYMVGGKQRRLQIRALSEPRLPKAAAAAIQAAFPKALVRGVDVENEMGLKLYEVELEQDGKELVVEVSPDGTIVAVESSVAAADLPKAVADAVAKVTRGAKVLGLEKEEIRAVPMLVKIEEPKVVYEVEFFKDGKKQEIEIAADGSIQEDDEEHEEDDYTSGDDEDDEGDEDEEDDD